MINEIGPLALRERLAEGTDVPLIDIRNPAELSQGAIPKARSVPLHLIPLRLHELPKDQDIVLYCHSGARSYHACRFLVQQGFDRVLNLRGGILAWARHGYEIEAPRAA